MTSLCDQVMSYLETLGFSFLEHSDDFLIADKVDFGGTRDTRLMWIPKEPGHERDIQYIERQLVRQFEEKTKRYPNARSWVVAHTFEGFSQDFRAEATKYEVLLRVPVQFFDTPFKYEEAPQIRSAIKELRSPVARIPQPYSVLSMGISQDGGGDLLEQLWNEFYFPDRPRLRIVVGPAGIGKTWLFRALFSRLYDHFLKQKSRLEFFPRPIPLIPSYLQTGMLRTHELLNSFMDSEVASPVRLETFKWMVAQGYASWLFDGLDELYMEDPEFFDVLTELLTRPDNRAQVLVCARESLLTSCEAFAEFLSDYGADPTVRVYRLEGWGHQSKVSFARLYFDPPRDSQFITYISRTDSLRSLSSLPYYCDLLRKIFEQERDRDFVDDVALIDHVVGQIIEREKGKGLLRLEDFVANGFHEWLETVAWEFLITNFRGIDKVDVETYAKLVLNPDLSQVEQQNAVTTLVQFPLFAAGVKPGVIAFEHELIAEYLAGRYCLSRIFKEPHRLASQLGEWPDFAESLIARYLSRQLAGSPEGIRSLEKAIRAEAPTGRGFINLLHLLLLANPARDALTTLKTTMEGRDLSQIRFEGRDLNGFSFRNCNLSNTVFRDCDLRNARFEGARLAGTRFEKIRREGMEGAHFGDLAHFEFVYIDKKLLDERLAFAEWIQSMMGERGPILQPCPSAIQLRTLFLKFIRPDGSGRRSQLPIQALTRGKRHAEAPSPEEFVKACLSFGYLQDPRWHDYIRRVPGDRYNEMVKFVTDWQLSANLRALLNSVCPKPGCKHVPQLA